jgi:hypothetical protein
MRKYRDLGTDHFSNRDRYKAIQRLVRRLNDLGCEVHVKSSSRSLPNVEAAEAFVA